MGLYNWRNKLLLDLPMLMRDHDPGNTLSVNRGRAGAALDATWTAGVTAPTKLGYRRGYSFDGADIMLVADDASIRFGTGDFTVLSTFGTTQSANPARTIVAKGTVGVDEWLFYRFAAGGIQSIRFYGDGGALNVTAVWTGRHQGVNTGVFVRSGDDGFLYIGGQQVATQAGIAAVDLSTTKDASIGSANEGGERYWVDDIYHVGMANFALSPHQVAQYHSTMMRRLHAL